MKCAINEAHCTVFEQHTAQCASLIDALRGFELGADGWQGSTVFQSSQVKTEDRRAYLERQRDGFLLYRRKE